MTPPTQPEVRLAPETIDYLEQKMRGAVREGIREVMTEDAARAFFNTGLQVLREQAAAHTGRFVLSSLWTVTKWLAIAVIVAAVLWSVGGGTLVKAVGKAVLSGPSSN